MYTFPSWRRLGLHPPRGEHWARRRQLSRFPPRHSPSAQWRGAAAERAAATGARAARRDRDTHCPRLRSAARAVATVDAILAGVKPVRLRRIRGGACETTYVRTYDVSRHSLSSSRNFYQRSSPFLPESPISSPAAAASETRVPSSLATTNGDRAGTQARVLADRAARSVRLCPLRRPRRRRWRQVLAHAREAAAGPPPSSPTLPSPPIPPASLTGHLRCPAAARGRFQGFNVLDRSLNVSPPHPDSPGGPHIPRPRVQGLLGEGAAPSTAAPPTCHPPLVCPELMCSPFPLIPPPIRRIF